MSDLDALRKDAKEKSESDGIQSWKPKAAGDELAGYVKDIEYVFTVHNPDGVYRLVIEDEDGVSWHLWCSGAVLSNQILDVMPNIDSPVVVLFEGKKKNKDGTREYNGYQVSATDKAWEPYDKARTVALMKQAIKQGEALDQPSTVDDGLAAPF